MITFSAIKKFNKDSSGWENYINWSKIWHLEETITIDVALCPFVLEELDQSDWEHIAYKEYHFFGFFKDVEYCIIRFKDFPNSQIIAINVNPHSEVSHELADKRFKFMGYDLVEEFTRISALTNCGGFPKAFSNNDLNKSGLIKSYEQAILIQKSLLEQYPEENHADCIIVAMWKFIK